MSACGMLDWSKSGMPIVTVFKRANVFVLFSVLRVSQSIMPNADVEVPGKVPSDS